MINMNDNQPLVSVLCLTMNHAAFVERSFQSILDQTYKNIEIIYLDNNSADNTFEIADKILSTSGVDYKKYKRDKNYGVALNVNFLVEKAVGKYVINISGDDWWEINNLEEKINFLEQQPQYGMVYSSFYKYYYNTGKCIINPDKKWCISGNIFDSLLVANFVSGIGTVIRKEVIDDVGNYDENALLEDWDLWIRIAQKYSIGYINKELVYYGQHGKGNITSNLQYMDEGYKYIFEKYKQYGKVSQAKKRIALNRIYLAATHKPSFKSLAFILKNFQLKTDYFKQLLKCVLGIVRIRFHNNYN